MVNPYQPPTAQLAPASLAGDLPRLLKVAQNQRAIMLCILASMIASVVIAFASLPGLVAAVPTLLVGLASLFFTIRLASAVYGSTGAAVSAIAIVGASALAFLVAPALGQLFVLVVLLVVNSRATKDLKQAGFRVGLLGGNPADVEARMSGR